MVVVVVVVVVVVAGNSGNLELLENELEKLFLNNDGDGCSGGIGGIFVSECTKLPTLYNDGDGSSKIEGGASSGSSSSIAGVGSGSGAKSLDVTFFLSLLRHHYPHIPLLHRNIRRLLSS